MESLIFKKYPIKIPIWTGPFLRKIDLSNYDNFRGIGKTNWEPYNIGFLADEKGNIYNNHNKWL